GDAHDLRTTAEWIRLAILDAAGEIAVPAFVSTISICIVFLPVFLLTEPAKSLFSPLALAVVGSMLASYFLSRTLVPVMAKYMLKGHAEPGHKDKVNPFAVLFHSVTRGIDRGFERMRENYHSLLAFLLTRRIIVVGLVILFMGASLSLIPFLGEDFFPAI